LWNAHRLLDYEAAKEGVGTPDGERQPQGKTLRL
jgi:hypothetical protein